MNKVESHRKPALRDALAFSWNACIGTTCSPNVNQIACTARWSPAPSAFLSPARHWRRPLLDFKDDAQFAQFRVTGQTKIEPASETYQGKRAAKIVFAPVPEGATRLPGRGHRGPGAQGPRLQPLRGHQPVGQESRAGRRRIVALRSGTRTAIAPSPFPRRSRSSRAAGSRSWPAGAARPRREANRLGPLLSEDESPAGHAADRRRSAPVALRRPTRRPDSGHAAGPEHRTGQRRWPSGRRIRSNRRSPRWLSGLDQLENTAAAANTRIPADRAPAGTRPDLGGRLRSLPTRSRSARAARRVVLSGPLVEASWLSDQEKVKAVTEFTLSNTPLGDEVFPLLAPATEPGGAGSRLPADHRRRPGQADERQAPQPRDVLHRRQRRRAQGRPQVSQTPGHAAGWDQRDQRRPPALRRPQAVEEPVARRHASHRHGLRRDRQAHQSRVPQSEADQDSWRGPAPPRKLDEAQGARPGRHPAR